MKKIFIVDTDKRFQAQIHEVCPADLVELRFFSSGMEIFLLLTTEKPHLLFLDLDIDDLNEFVMRDLLKKITVTYAIPLLVTYSDKSEAALKQYEKLNYRPDGYFKKPLTPEHLKELIYRYLQLQEEVKSDETDTLLEFTPPTLPAKEGDLVEFGETIEDEEDSFSDENLDLLVRGGAVDTGEDLAPITPKEKDDRENTNPFGDDQEAPSFNENLLETRRDESKKTPRSNLDDRNEIDIETELGLDDKFADSFLPSASAEPQVVAVASPPQTPQATREMENQLISLERQNEFLRVENKKLLAQYQQVESQANLTRDENQQLKLQLDEILGQAHQDRKELQHKHTSLSDQLDSLAQEKALLLSQLDSQIESLNNVHKEKNLLLQQIDTLNTQVTQLTAEKEALLEKLTLLADQVKHDATTKDSLQQQIHDVTNRLTDKEREMVAVNHEFEKLLQEKSDLLIQETEDRLNKEFHQKEERLIQSLRKFQEETKRKESELLAEIETLSQNQHSIVTEREELKKREESLNRTVSTLAEEKVLLSERITAFEKEWARSRQVMEEMEAIHAKAVEQLNQELDNKQTHITDLTTKLDAITELLKNALAITLQDS